MCTCTNPLSILTTILLRPSTTASFPLMSTPDILINSTQPRGVQGTTQHPISPLASLPALLSVRPSTSCDRTHMQAIYRNSSNTAKHNKNLYLGSCFQREVGCLRWNQTHGILCSRQMVRPTEIARQLSWLSSNPTSFFFTMPQFGKRMM